MAQTSIATGDAIAVEKFNAMAFREYVDKLILKPWMGTSAEAVIHVQEDILKSVGDAVTFNLAGALSGAGITGDSTMEGNEEAMNFYGHRLVIDQVKNAVLLAGSMTERRAAFSLRMEALHALTTWLAQKVEDDAFAALASVDGTAYGSAAEAAKDTFLAANADRYLFGDSVANNGTTNDHSASLTQIDATNDILDTDQITLAKRLAELASPAIRPVRIENGEEVYLMLVHPLCGRDLKASTAWQNAQRDAAFRGSSNPIFTGAIGMYDGVIVKESPKCLLLADVGDGGTVDVANNSLMGAQALIMAHGGYEGGGKVVVTEKLFDYDDRPGFQVKSTYAIEKPVFNTSQQHGVVTVFSAAEPD